MELLVIPVLHLGSPYIEGVCHRDVLVIHNLRDTFFCVLYVDFILSIPLFSQARVHCGRAMCQSGIDCFPSNHLSSFHSPCFFWKGSFPYFVVSASRFSSETVITFLKST